MQKKICLIGAFAVGKTSLVGRFVRSIFSEKYLTTVGVKIDKKELALGDKKLTLLIWDIAGEDSAQAVNMNYVRGAFGYLLVADGTRAKTLEQAIRLKEEVGKAIGEKPFILLLNKADLTDQWEVSQETVSQLKEEGWEVFETSAKTGENVETAFQQLAEKMLSPD